MSGETPSQTVGPYFAIGLTPEVFARRPIATSVLRGPDTPGEPIRVQGRVFDGAGAPVEDAMIEIWQADATGQYPGETSLQTGGLRRSFRGLGRAGTNSEGGFSFETIKPGQVPGPGNSMQAPHLNVAVFSRGLLTHAFTRIYFDDEEDANRLDPILELVPPERRATLLAHGESAPTGKVYHFDIRLQGDNETVFLDP